MTAAVQYWRERAESAESEVDRCNEKCRELKWQIMQLRKEIQMFDTITQHQNSIVNPDAVAEWKHECSSMECAKRADAGRAMLDNIRQRFPSEIARAEKAVELWANAAQEKIDAETRYTLKAIEFHSELVAVLETYLCGDNSAESMNEARNIQARLKAF